MSFFYLANGIITSKVICDKLLIHETKKPENKKTDIHLISENITVKTEFLKSLEDSSLEDDDSFDDNDDMTEEQYFNLITESDIKLMSVPQIKNLCKRYNIKTYGKRVYMIY